MSLADLLFPPTTTAPGWASAFGTGSQTIPNPVANWFDTNSGTLAGLGSLLTGAGAGLASASPNDPHALLSGFANGLANANPQAAFQQAATNAQIQKTQQAQNQTIQALKNSGPSNADLVAQAMSGDVAGAWQTFVARKQQGAAAALLGSKDASPQQIQMAQSGAINPQQAWQATLPQQVSPYGGGFITPLTGQPVDAFGSGPSSVKNVALAIEGKSPNGAVLAPDLSHYSKQVQNAIQTQLAADGTDLATLQLQWKAAQKLTDTMNGVSFTRLRTATDTTAKSLDIIDNLADQWAALKIPGVGALTPLNSAQFQAALRGAYGQKAAQIATALQGQIHDSAAEIGSIFRNGNTPTDQAMEQASTQLDTGWSTDTLHAMTNLIRQNMQKRMQSFKDAGYDPTNPYLNKQGPSAVPLTQVVEGTTLSYPGGNTNSPGIPSGAATQYPNAPQIGTVVDGFAYIGGDPASPASWLKAQ